MTIIVLSKDAHKHLEHLPKSDQAKIRKKLRALQENPLLGKKLSGDLESSRSFRAWPYRIIYKFNKQNERIEVSDIPHRQGAYK